jgi:aryl-alcohol dehydrogenase-like predicted oxidoreductase
LQIPYSALQLEHEAAIAQAVSAGVGVVIRGGVARGEPGAGQGAIDVWQRWEQANMGELLEGLSATEFMLRFTLSNPDIHTTIVGTLNPAHLQENVAAVGQGPLPASVYSEARRRLAAA